MDGYSRWWVGEWVCSFLPWCHRTPWLQTLLLDDNGFTGRMLARLLSTLEYDKSLQTLSLANNSLSETKVTEALRKVFKHNATLTDLDLR